LAGASRCNSCSSSHTSSAAGPSISGRRRVSHSGSGCSSDSAQDHGANMIGLPSTLHRVASTGSVGSWGTASTNPNRRHRQLSQAGSAARSETGTDVLDRLTGFFLWVSVPVPVVVGDTMMMMSERLFAREDSESDVGKSQRIRSNSNASSAPIQAPPTSTSTSRIFYFLGEEKFSFSIRSTRKRTRTRKRACTSEDYVAPCLCICISGCIQSSRSLDRVA
jgi:hypothetical protein